MMSKDIDRMTGTVQEMAGIQRDSQKAVADNFTSFQKRSMGLAQDGLKFLELQRDNARVAQEWWSSGVKLMEIQQRNVDFARSWMNDGIAALRSQTEQNVRTAEILARSVRAQQESFLKLTQTWTGTYRNFFTPFMDYAQEGMKTAQRTTQQGLENTQQGMRLVEEATEKTAETTAQVAQKNGRQNKFLDALKNGGYDEMNVGDIAKKLDGLSEDELKKVREYEKRHKNRDTLVEQIDRKIKATS